jgi:hypothetical protein
MFNKGMKNGKCRIIDQKKCKVGVFVDDVEQGIWSTYQNDGSGEE